MYNVPASYQSGGLEMAKAYSFNHVVENLGPHMLPLIGRADWNDCLNLNCFSWDPNESFQTTENNSEGSEAESLMIAGLFVVMKTMHAIMKLTLKSSFHVLESILNFFISQNVIVQTAMRKA